MNMKRKMVNLLYKLKRYQTYKIHKKIKLWWYIFNNRIKIRLKSRLTLKSICNKKKLYLIWEFNKINQIWVQ